MISPDGQPTCLTHEPTFPQLNRLAMSAARTDLAGWLPLVDFHHPLPSQVGDMLNNKHELGEAKVANLPTPQPLHAAQVGLAGASQQDVTV